jgi:NAD+ diphosphatase
LPALNDRSARNGFAGGTLERGSETREEDCIEKALAAADTAIYLFNADQLFFPTLAANSPRLSMAQASALGMDPDSLIFLGSDAAGAVLAARTSWSEEHSDSLASQGIEMLPIRGLAESGRFLPSAMGDVAYARSLVDWHQNHSFCARCGHATKIANGGARRDCPKCERQHFPRVDPVAIMLVVDGDRCLLGRGAHFKPGMYSCLAGFVEPGETFESAVQREVFEESGIVCGNVRYHSTQPWPFVSSLMMGAIADAQTTDLVPDMDELEDVRWFTRDEVTKMAAGNHPDELVLPPDFAIARQIIDSYLRNEKI